MKTKSNELSKAVAELTVTLKKRAVQVQSLNSLLRASHVIIMGYREGMIGKTDAQRQHNKVSGLIEKTLDNMDRLERGVITSKSGGGL